MNFLQYKMVEELYKATGFTVQQAIRMVDEELGKLRREKE